MAMYYGDENGKAQEIVVVGMQGPAGPQGPQGEPGPQGPTGQGVPEGGSPGQVLVAGGNNPEWKNTFRNSSGVGIDFSTANGYLLGHWFINNPSFASGFQITGGEAEVTMPESPTDRQIVNKAYVDDKVQASTEDLEAGVSSLETGKIYLVYE